MLRTKGNKSKKSRQQAEKQPPKNTAVYVTSIPLDATVEEVHEVFSRYGVIADGIDSGTPRIKLYTDGDGKPKGDALVVYFRPESVDLAINMLDETDFRLGEKGPDGPMRVKAAERSYKKVQDLPETGDAKKAPSAREKKKIIAKTQKMNK
jgi:HIV Tat-specific factor 1